MRYDLIPVLALEQCAIGWTKGQEKYKDHPAVGDPSTHYTDIELISKIMRHLQEYRKGEQFDSETGVHHMACVANNAMMLCEKDLNRGIDKDKDNE